MSGGEGDPESQYAAGVFSERHSARMFLTEVHFIQTLGQSARTTCALHSINNEYFMYMTIEDSEHSSVCVYETIYRHRMNLRFGVKGRRPA